MPAQGSLAEIKTAAHVAATIRVHKHTVMAAMAEATGSCSPIAKGRGEDVEMDEQTNTTLVTKRRGRGFEPQADGPSSDGVQRGGAFDQVPAGTEDVGMDDVTAQDPAQGAESTATTVAPLQPAASVEGYIVMVLGIDEEASEEEVVDKLSDYGKVQSCHLNLDRRTGYVKGYALVEFAALQEAKACVMACRRDEVTLMDRALQADFAFVQPPPRSTRRPARIADEEGEEAKRRSIMSGDEQEDHRAARYRSRSPDRRR